MVDPLSGTKATTDFITDMMTTLAGDTSELEKAEPTDKALSQDGQHLYDACVAGFGPDGEKFAPVCRSYAQDFDHRHPGGFGEVLGSSDDAPEVQKTVSTAGMSAGLGSPSAEVHLTDVGTRRRRGQG